MPNRAGICTLTKIVALALATFMWASACDDSPSGPQVFIDRPQVEPVPNDQAVDVANSPTLIWPSADAFDQSARYELYLDTVNPPTLYAVNLTDTVFRPDWLESGWTYYWRVITKGVRRRNPASPLWSFTTKSITYPVAVGNSWRYRSNSWYENLQPKSLVPRFGDTTFVIREVEIDNFDSAIGGPGRYRFHTGTTGRTRPSEASCYYEVHQDGLYMTMAEVGTGSGVWPKTGKGISYSFAGRTFNSTNALSAFLGAGIPGGFAAGSDHDYPRKSLQYPLRIGTQWTYTENHATPGSVVRRVVDRQSIEIGLGRFDCFVIRQLHNLAEDGTWDNTLEIVDYVAAEGLIKRRTIARDVQINDWGHAYPIGTADIVIEAFLTDFDLIDP